MPPLALRGSGWSRNALGEYVLFDRKKPLPPLSPELNEARKFVIVSFATASAGVTARASCKTANCVVALNVTDCTATDSPDVPTLSWPATYRQQNTF